MKKFSLIIPAYNEEKNLETLLNKTLAAAREYEMAPADFSILIVENGSLDNSFSVLCELIDKHQWQDRVRIVRVRENRGYGHGILAGLKVADSEIVGWTHADLQCDPKNAFKAYQILKDSGDQPTLVKGWRVGRSKKDRFVSWVFATLALWILGLRVSEINAQPKVFPRALLAHFTHPPENFALDLYLLYVAQKKGYLIKSFDVYFPPRIHGISHWAGNFAGRYKTIWGMILYMWDLRRKGPS